MYKPHTFAKELLYDGQSSRSEYNVMLLDLLQQKLFRKLSGHLVSETIIFKTFLTP